MKTQCTVAFISSRSGWETQKNTQNKFLPTLNFPLNKSKLNPSGESKHGGGVKKENSSALMFQEEATVLR